jgi:hypothetical protein
MGMFDDIKYELDCPACGTHLSGFQSKDGPCEMLLLEPREVEHFYNSCPGCNAWIDFWVTPPTKAHVTAKYRTYQERSDKTNILGTDIELPNNGEIDWHPIEVTVRVPR